MTMDPYSIVLYPFVTEKSMSHMEKNNALEFVVKGRNKALIKKAVERCFVK
jgi:ribosomal protein L23